MSKIGEVTVNIPGYGNGNIVNVYSSVDDMSNDRYSNDYILCGATYDGSYHSNCCIAISYDNTNEAYLEYGIPWTIKDSNGKTCYILTEPYFPTECVVTYSAPQISLCYDSACSSSITISAGSTITPTGKPTYILLWTDNCGNSGQVSGTLEYSSISCSRSDSNLVYTFTSSTGAFTATNRLAKAGGGTNKIATLTASTTVNGVTGSTSVSVYMEYLDTNTDFKNYNVWILYSEGRGGSKEYNITPDYVWGTLRIPYYFNNISFTLKSCSSYSAALSEGCVNPPDEGTNRGEGYYILSMPTSSSLLMFTVSSSSGEKTATVGSDNVDLSDGTGDLN